MGKREFTYGEDGFKGADARGGILVQVFPTRFLEESEGPCKYDDEFREREKGLLEKESFGLESKMVWEPERRGGAGRDRLDWTAPSPGPSMVNFATEKGSFKLLDIKKNILKLVR